MQIIRFIVIALVCEAYVTGSVFDTELYESVIDEEQCEQQLNYLGQNSLGLQFLDASARIPSGISSGNVNDLGDYFQCLAIDQFVDQMEIKGKYCTVTVPLTQNPIQIPEFPDFPDNITIPFPPINGTWPWPPPDNETMDTLEQYSNVRQRAMTLLGFAEEQKENSLDSRIFPMLITAQLGATLAFCVPRVCPARQAIDYFQERLLFLNFTYNEFYCRLPNDKPFVAADYVAISIFSVIGLLLLVSTAYDLCCVFYHKREANKLYRSFSLYTNTRRFLNFSSSPGAVECIDGIRAISMIWVVAGHTYGIALMGFVHNIVDILGWLRKFSSTWINSAPISVDTFFMLSGVLAVYVTIGKIKRERFLRSIHLFYLNRLLRMFPLLAAVVLLQASLLNHISDGPFWQNMGHAVDTCRENWWAALLHIQNYTNSSGICLMQSWYLSVDTQLYIVCPLILVWMFGPRKYAWMALTLVVLLSLVATTVVSFMYNFRAAIIQNDDVLQYSEKYYISTLTRASPFFVGMVYGYMLHLWRNKRIHISKVNVILLWALSLALMAFCIFSIYPVMQLDHDAQIFDNFLNAYMRAIWACALGWLIFACVQGYGGPINWFLSLRMWKLPARLSYAMYLIHYPIIMIANGSWVKTYYFSNGDSIYRFMSNLMITFIAAFVLCITIDAPFSTLQKLLLSLGTKTPLPQVQPKSESKQNITEEFATNL